MAALYTVQWFILLFPLPLLAQFQVEPWRPWSLPSATWRLSIEQSGPRPGWTALGASMQGPKWALHTLLSPYGQPYVAGLAKLSLGYGKHLQGGWGVESGMPHLYLSYQQVVGPSTQIEARIRSSTTAFWSGLLQVQQLTENGWTLSVTAIRNPLGEVEWVLGGRPMGHAHFRGVFVSTSGRWRVIWERRNGRICFGSGPYFSNWMGLYGDNLPPG